MLSIINRSYTAIEGEILVLTFSSSIILNRSLQFTKVAASRCKCDWLKSAWIWLTSATQSHECDWLESAWIWLTSATQSHECDWLRLEKMWPTATTWWRRLRGLTTMDSIIDSSDSKLFRSVTRNPFHVLSHLFPATRESNYDLRPRKHRYTLTAASNWLKKNFVQRMIFRDSYWLLNHPEYCFL